MSEADRQLMTNMVTENGGLYKFQFLKMDPDLQDLIIEGLDTRQMTLAEAGKLAVSEGFQITPESIRRYYQRLLSNRRNSEVRNAWIMAGDRLREMGADKVLQMFLTYMMGQLMGGVEAGQIDFPVKDFLKLLGDIPEQLMLAQQSANANGNAKKKETIDVTPVSDEGKRKIRQDVYGF